MLPISRFSPQTPTDPNSNRNPIFAKFKLKASHEKPYNPSNTYKHAYSHMMDKYPDLKIGNMPLRKPNQPEDFDCNAHLVSEKMINMVISNQIKPETSYTNK